MKQQFQCTINIFIGAFKFSKILKLGEMADSGDELYNAARNTAY